MGFEDLKLLEDKKHFWIEGKHMVIRNIVERLEPDSLLDIGCGTGSLLLSLAAKVPLITGIDIFQDAIEHCRKKLPSATFIVADAAGIPFNDAFFDLVLALDVMEHVDRDDIVTKEIFRVLKPGGHAVLMVPAMKSLFSLRDKILGHHRRYNKKELLVVLQESGFRITYMNYYNFLLFPIVFIARLLRLDDRNPGNTANAILKFIITGEAKLSKKVRFPWGSSLIAIGEKPYV